MFANISGITLFTESPDNGLPVKSSEAAILVSKRELMSRRSLSDKSTEYRLCNPDRGAKQAILSSCRERPARLGRYSMGLVLFKSQSMIERTLRLIRPSRPERSSIDPPPIAKYVSCCQLDSPCIFFKCGAFNRSDWTLGIVGKEEISVRPSLPSASQRRCVSCESGAKLVKLPSPIFKSVRFEMEDTAVRSVCCKPFTESARLVRHVDPLKAEVPCNVSEDTTPREDKLARFPSGERSSMGCDEDEG